jgi:hypothetical protein
VQEVTAWQARPLEPLYPVAFFALRVKIRNETVVRSKAVYLALAVPDGTRIPDTATQRCEPRHAGTPEPRNPVERRNDPEPRNPEPEPQNQPGFSQP